MPDANTSVLKIKVKLACIQLAVGPDKQTNLRHAADMVAQAAASGSKIVVLPECFNSPYGCAFFPDYAESLLPSSLVEDQAPSYKALSEMASKNKIYLIGGSIPEIDPVTKKYYNTSLVFGPDGSLLASHRKVHLFDVDIPDGISFHESDILSPGNKITLVNLPEYGIISVAICYDMRFPELSTIAARNGAFALIFPSAFNMTTGPLHWQLQGQVRAMDNQVYVAMCSPARDIGSSYHAWGHSMVVDPMAQVVAQAEEQECIVYWTLDGDVIAQARRSIPLSAQRRFDVYPDIGQGGDIQIHGPDL